MAKLKKAEIHNGRICLEGRSLSNPEILELKVLNRVYDPREGREVVERELQKLVENNMPQKADAYVLGKSMANFLAGIMGSYESVLYINSGKK